ncbi:hypothetical protein AGLY_002172 [Aphis glycines]|uniref:Uncharacterized protein n=1 Tax=Aphis glycines TaxID=307491 RepID=A0A6G0U515_APHGL|nr:hypothetical protein AGLY_002172 [Aphis glycines]
MRNGYSTNDQMHLYLHHCQTPQQVKSVPVKHPTFLANTTPHTPPDEGLSTNATRQRFTHFCVLNTSDYIEQYFWKENRCSFLRILKCFLTITQNNKRIREVRTQLIFFLFCLSWYLQQGTTAEFLHREKNSLGTASTMNIGAVQRSQELPQPFPSPRILAPSVIPRVKCWFIDLIQQDPSYTHPSVHLTIYVFDISAYIRFYRLLFNFVIKIEIIKITI